SLPRNNPVSMRLWSAKEGASRTGITACTGFTGSNLRNCPDTHPSPKVDRGPNGHKRRHKSWIVSRSGGPAAERGLGGTVLALTGRAVERESKGRRDIMFQTLYVRSIRGDRRLSRRMLAPVAMAASFALLPPPAFAQSAATPPEPTSAAGPPPQPTAPAK